MQKEIKVINGQTIFDLALYCYNDASLVYDLISENPTITDISMDLTGLTLVYTPKQVVQYEAKQNAKKLNKLVTIKSEQSLFDLSLQYYGDVSFIYDLIQKNSFIENILVNDVNGNIIELENIKDYVTEFYNKKDLTVGTNTIVKNFLLQEDGFYLLQENGSKILL
jgi:hypothetical protein